MSVMTSGKHAQRGVVCEALGLDGRHETRRDEPLGFVVELPCGARPGPAERALYLLGELVGGPRADREQAEDGERGGRQRGRHKLDGGRGQWAGAFSPRLRAG